MRVIIAEKPSLARAIAAALPGSSQRSGHHIVCSSGDTVAWCAGHVLELAPPEDYAAELKTWAFESLPIVPEQWRYRVSRCELVASLRRLIARATRVVHAGDPDREGQLLVDEVLQYLGWQGPTDRLLVTDLSPAAVRRALAALEPNERFQPLYAAALARQRADWIYGLNLTRLYTLRARLAGYQGVLSVGRVQTPLLGLIVRRDREIESFVPKPFYGVEATLCTRDGSELKASWAVGKEYEAFTDSEGRLLSRQVAEAISRKTSCKAAVVTLFEQKPQAQAPPLPYSLAELQVDAGRRFGLSAAQVLELAQRLYELELITYPRSDCSYLPEVHWGQARGVLEAITARAPRLVEACAAADPGRRSRAWNDAKITAHHAIIPACSQTSCGLNDSERAIYELVALRYVQQFLPAFEFLVTKVELSIAGETFVVHGREVVALGWRAFGKEFRESRGEEEREEEAADAVLPALRQGQTLSCVQVVVLDKRTQPPKPFTDATLIQAMCNVAKFVSDPRARQILKETDGIGTPATRADIIETLFERGYVHRQRKQIRSTAVGRAFIEALPEVATTPDLTAVWESAIRRIHDRELELERFLGGVTQQLGELVRRGKAEGPLTLPTAGVAASSRRQRRRPARKRPKRAKGAAAAPRRASA